MKKFIFFVGLLFLFYSGIAQNTNPGYKYAVKLYNLTTYEDYSNSGNDTNQYSFRYSTENLRIFHPTVAFQWITKNGNFQEVELVDFMYSITGKDGKDTTEWGQLEEDFTFKKTNLSFRYEYNVNFLKGRDARFVPSLGFGVNPYYWHYTDLPAITSQYRTAENIVGAKIYLTPRVIYHISPRFFLDVNIPICVMDSYFDSFNNEDPTLSIDQRQVNTINLEVFPKIFSGRIGVGLRF
jgi:hypothetical protein